jgi:hypothetical protein
VTRRLLLLGCRQAASHTPHLATTVLQINATPSQPHPLTGFMKWSPTTRSGRWVAAARRVMAIEEVLLARMA